MKNVTLFKCIVIVVITLLSSALSAQWSLTGNSGTTPGTNFIGTTDSKELKFKTSNAERMHIGADGFVGIGTTTSINGSRFGLSVSSVFSNAGMYINSNSQTIFGVTYTTKPTYGYAINGISKGYHCLDNGNWKLNLNGADKLLVKENGDVGIGISNPTQRLDVDGGGKFAGSLTASGAISGASGSFGGLYADGYVTFDGTYPQKFTVNMESRINESLYVDGLLTGEQIHGFTNNSGPGVTGKAVYNHPTLSSMGVFGSNNSSPNAYGVVCQGSGYYTGNWFQLSDRKLKKDVQPIQNAISRIMQLKPKSYKYLGRAYVPTPVVKLYFREADVVEPYEVMGKLDVELPSSMNMNKIQSKVMAIARSKGADALIIDNFDQTTGGFVTTGVGATSSGDNGNVSGSKRRTDIKKDIVVKASLLKYKKNIQQ